MKDIGIIIQARTGSSRLPNKVILPFYKNLSILDIIISKFLGYKAIKVILSTSRNINDDTLIDIAKQKGISFYRGDEDDVLLRFYNTAIKFNLNTIVRVCADNPFLDIKSIDKLISIYKEDNSIDYLSYKNHDGLPVIRSHIGIFAEIVSFKALKKSKEATHEDYYREHVTNYIYDNPELFNIKLENSFKEVFDRNDLRFTVDDLDDFNNLKNIFNIYYNNDYDLIKTIRFVDKNPSVIKVMKKNIKKYDK